MPKNLPQPLLCKIIFQARYKPSLRFYDLLNSAVQNFDIYPTWKTDRLYVVLHDYVRRCSLAVRHNNFSYDQDFGNKSEQQVDIQDAIEKLPGLLEIASFIRLGFRRQYLIPVEMTHDQIANILNIKFLAQDEALLNIFPPQFEDMTSVTVFSDGTLKLRTVIGPMDKKEIPQFIQFNKEYHLNRDQPEEDFAQIVKRYPDLAVFIDVDVFRADGEIPLNSIVPFFKEAESKLEKLILNLRHYIFAREQEKMAAPEGTNISDSDPNRQSQSSYIDNSRQTQSESWPPISQWAFIYPDETTEATFIPGDYHLGLQTEVGQTRRSQPEQTSQAIAEYQEIMRAHYMKPILKSLHKVQPHAGSPSATIYINELLHKIHEFDKKSPDDPIQEVLSALYDALITDNLWTSYTATQYKNAEQILSRLLEQPINQGNIDWAINKLDEAGFDTLPFELLVDDD